MSSVLQFTDIILLTLGVILGVSLAILVIASTYYYKKPVERILRNTNGHSQAGEVIIPSDDGVDNWISELKSE